MRIKIYSNLRYIVRKEPFVTQLLMLHLNFEFVYTLFSSAVKNNQIFFKDLPKFDSIENISLFPTKWKRAVLPRN